MIQTGPPSTPELEVQLVFILIRVMNVYHLIGVSSTSMSVMSDYG